MGSKIIVSAGGKGLQEQPEFSPDYEKDWQVPP